MSSFEKTHQPEATIIYEGLCSYEALQVPRGYLGMSSIGNVCERQSWFSWRQTSGRFTDGRILMLFETGRHVEEIVCRALRLAGFVLKNSFPDPQASFADHGGFFSGHPDGYILDEYGDLVLEVKSSNTNKFKAFKEKGVQEVYPAYYVQIQLYLHYSGLKKACFIVMNKENSELYIEYVPYNETTAIQAISKASRIIQTHTEKGSIYFPERFSEDQKCQGCQWCRYLVPCWQPDESLQSVQTCRSCAYLVIGSDFKPFCGHNAHKFPLKEISRGCQQWAWVVRCPWTVEA